MADSVRELVIKVTVDSSGAKKGFADVEGGQKKATVGSQALGTALGGMAVKLAEVAAQAVKAGFAMAKELVFGTAAAADEIAKTSKQLGIASDGLQRLRGAAALTGADTASLDKGVRILTKGLADAALKGTGPAAEALKTLGLEVADVDSLLQEGDIEGAMGVIGDAFNETGDSAQKSAALLKLLGGAGAKLRPLIESGSEGVRAMGEQIQATGSVIEDEALGQFEALVDAQFLLDKQTEGLTNTLALAAAPAVKDIADLIRLWVADNDDFIQQDLPETIAQVADRAIQLAEFTLDLISTWREFTRDSSDLAEIMLEDVSPGLDTVGEGLQSLTAFADGLALAMNDVVISFLESVGAGEELIAVFKEIKAGIVGDDEARVERGAGALLGGAQLQGGGARSGDVKSILDPRFAVEAESSGDTTKLKTIAGDPKFSDGDRARAGAKAAQIDQVEASKADAAAQGASDRRRSSVDRSRARSAALRPRRGGRGGSGRATGPTETSIGDLVANAVGGAAPQALRSATSAMSGTLFVSTDNSTTINMGNVSTDVTVSAALPTEVGPAVADAVRVVVRDEIGEQVREVQEVNTVRRNVGP